MKKIKLNLHLWNKSLFLGASFLVFAIIASAYWGMTYASDLTDTGTVVIPPAPTIPIPPTNLSYNNVTSSSVVLNWNDNSTNEDKYNIEKRLVSEAGVTNANYGTAEIITLPADSKSYTDSSLTAGNKYYYRVQSCLSNVGCSAFSTFVTVAITNANNPGGTTTSCTDIKFAFGSDKITYNVGDNVYYTWTCYPADTTSSVYVFLKKPDGSTHVMNNSSGTASSVPSAQGANYVSTANLTPGTYTLKACLNTSCASGTVSSTLTFNLTSSVENPVVVEKPTEFMNGPLTETSTSIVLKWKDNSSNETKFRIKRKLNAETSYADSSFVDIAANHIEYTDNVNLVPGVKYDYFLVACYSDSVCSPETILSGIVIPVAVIPNDPPAPPSSPLNFNYSPVTSASTVIKLTWTNGVSLNNQIRFTQILKRLKGTGDFKFYTKIAIPGNTYFEDRYAVKGTHYDYRIRTCYTEALCSSEIVELSDVYIPLATVVAPIEPAPIPVVEVKMPSELKKEIISSDLSNPSVKILWKDNSLNETRFELEKKTNVSSSYVSVEDEISRNLVSYTDKIDYNVYYKYRLRACNLEKCSDYVYLAEIVYVQKPEEPVKTVTPVEEVKTITVPETREIVEPSPVVIKTTPVIESPNTSTTTQITPVKDVIDTSIREVLSTISTVEVSTAKLVEQSTLIYKDTNKDGISDYDSKYIYNIDPVKSSPISIFEGKKINAAEKILLGFDPSKTELVKIKVEEPIESKAKSVLSYNVKKIELNKENKIAIKGQALPNSYITIYIYSTPIMVTVKTDSKGEWEYVLDKELEDGNHTIYTATVNNTGNIIAKSSPYTFTKTAEAVALEDVPVAEASVSVEKPGFISGRKDIFFFVIAFLMAVGIILILVGLFTKNNGSKEDGPVVS